MDHVGLEHQLLRVLHRHDGVALEEVGHLDELQLFLLDHSPRTACLVQDIGHIASGDISIGGLGPTRSSEEATFRMQNILIY